MFFGDINVYPNHTYIIHLLCIQSKFILANKKPPKGLRLVKSAAAGWILVSGLGLQWGSPFLFHPNHKRVSAIRHLDPAMAGEEK